MDIKVKQVTLWTKKSREIGLIPLKLVYKEGVIINHKLTHVNFKENNQLY